MTTFWILSIALLVLAAVFIFYPLWSARRYQGTSLEVSDADRTAQNVDIFKERLQELETELAQGKLDQAQFDELKTELEGTLVEDAGSATSAKKSKSAPKDPFAKMGVAIAIVLTVIVGATSYYLYFKWGEYDKVAKRENAPFNSEDIAKAREAAQRGDMDSLLAQLQEKLVENPDNLEGWSLLARSALNLEKYELAEKAFFEVARILEENRQEQAPVYGMIAQARFFGGGGELSIDVQNMVNRAFQLNPNESNSLGVLAIHSFENGQYKDAIDYWERIIRFDPNHISRASIESAILRAKRLAGIEAPDEPAAQPVVSDAQAPVQPSTAAQTTESLVNDPNVAQIQVTVDISEAIKAKAKPTDFVFIFARAPSGLPLPLAASRHTVADLPVTVVLNDSKAMAPMAKLSNVQEANVVARVSKSGQPIATPGDLEGRVEAVKTFGGEKVLVTIETEL